MWTNDIVITIVGFLVLTGIIWLLWKFNKSVKGMDLGEAMVTMAVDRHETIFFIMIGFLFITGAITAASLHNPSSAEQLNPLARIGSHTILNIIGAVASLTLVRDIATVFAKWIPPKERALRVVMCLGIMLAALYMPYVNLELAARSAGVIYEFDLYWYHFWNGQKAYESFLISQGQPPTVRASELLPTGIHILMAEMACHYLLVALEGMRNIVSVKRRTMLMEKVYRDLMIDPTNGKSFAPAPNLSNSGTQQNPTPGQQRQLTDLPKNATFVLSRIGYSGGKLDNLTTDVEAAILKIEDQSTRFGMAARLAKIVAELKTADGMANGPAKETKTKEAIAKIYYFLQKPAVDDQGQELPFDKRGLNIQVRGGNNFQ